MPAGELVFNQLTGGSNSMRSIYLPVRTATAIARQQLVATAAARWTVPAAELSTHDGVVIHRNGKRASYGSLAAAAAVSTLADVRSDRAEIWSSLKVPITAQQEIAKLLGLPSTALTVHVVQGGGSFGRHLFHDVAAEASQKMGKPVKLMWSRTDDFRHGRTHPMCISRIRATYAAGTVLSYEQRHTSVQTDFGHGLGEILTATAAKLPGGGNLSFAESIFELTQSSPYDFGVTTQLLTEVPLRFATGSMRNIYSPNVVCAQELVVDQLAAAMGKDPVEFRRAFLKDDRLTAVLTKAVEIGGWGKPLPDGVAQGIGLHAEYRAAVASLVEIDCRPETMHRKIRDAVTGPRVTKELIVVDPGFAINPRGLEAQMIGGMNDAIAIALTSSLHMDRGIPLEGSWDHYFYTRQWNTPLEMRSRTDGLTNY